MQMPAIKKRFTPFPLFPPVKINLSKDLFTGENGENRGKQELSKVFQGSTDSCGIEVENGNSRLRLRARARARTDLGPTLESSCRGRLFMQMPATPFPLFAPVKIISVKI